MLLEGKWKVTVTSGPWWFRLMNWLHDVKIIDCDSGYNLARGRKWGYFEITEDVCKDLWILKYADMPIIDDIWAVSHDMLFGRFHWKGRFVGNFKMERIK